MNFFTSDKLEVSDYNLRSISTMLFIYGLGKTLDYFCTISVFSLD